MDDWIYLNNFNGDKIDKIYKYKKSLIKLNKYHKSNINKLSNNQKEHYIQLYNEIFNNKISLITKIGYCIFFSIKNINNIDDDFFNDKVKNKIKFFNDIFKKSFYRLMLFKNKNDFLNKGYNNFALKLLLNWHYNCFKFNKVKFFIKKKYNLNYDYENIFNYCKKDEIIINRNTNANKNEDIINILNKCILSYNVFNPKFNKDECIKNVYSSSAGIEGWYNYYYILLKDNFKKWKNK